MLIDMHAHSSGISACCRIPAPDVIRAAADSGIDGIILTNHYHKPYVTDGDYDSFARRYVNEYLYAKSCGDAAGYPVHFGIEISMEKYGRAHLLVYGVKTDFVLECPMLFDCTQSELYHLVREVGGALIQAHPMRGGKNVLLDPAFLDGVEINSHPLYDCTHLDELTAFAHEHGLILTSGGDFHADSHRPHCGAYLPDALDFSQLGGYLRETESIELCCQEPGEYVSHTTLYHRHPE